MSPSTPASFLIMLAGSPISVNKTKTKLACPKRSDREKRTGKSKRKNARRPGKGRRKPPVEINPVQTGGGGFGSPRPL